MNDETKIDEESLTEDDLALACDLDSDVSLLGYVRCAEHTE